MPGERGPGTGPRRAPRPGSERCRDSPPGRTCGGCFPAQKSLQGIPSTNMGSNRLEAEGGLVRKSLWRRRLEKTGDFPRKELSGGCAGPCEAPPGCEGLSPRARRRWCGLGAVQPPRAAVLATPALQVPKLPRQLVLVIAPAERWQQGPALLFPATRQVCCLRGSLPLSPALTFSRGTCTEALAELAGIGAGNQEASRGAGSRARREASAVVRLQLARPAAGAQFPIQRLPCPRTCIQGARGEFSCRTPAGVRTCTL